MKGFLVDMKNVQGINPIILRDQITIGTSLKSSELQCLSQTISSVFVKIIMCRGTVKLKFVFNRYFSSVLMFILF